MTKNKPKPKTEPEPKPKPQSKNEDEPKKTHAEKVDELTAEFAKLYGTNASKLEGWRDLCRDVGVEEGTSITQCKKNLKAVSVNIWDLMAAKPRGKKPKWFASKKALKRDLGKEGRCYPLKAAKANGFLTALLVQLRF